MNIFFQFVQKFFSIQKSEVSTIIHIDRLFARVEFKFFQLLRRCEVVVYGVINFVVVAVFEVLRNRVQAENIFDFVKFLTVVEQVF